MNVERDMSLRGIAPDEFGWAEFEAQYLKKIDCPSYMELGALAEGQAGAEETRLCSHRKWAPRSSVLPVGHCRTP